MLRNIDGIGRIVLPEEYRRKLRIHAGDQVAITLSGDTIIIKKPAEDKDDGVMA